MTSNLPFFPLVIISGPFSPTRPNEPLSIKSRGPPSAKAATSLPINMRVLGAREPAMNGFIIADDFIGAENSFSSSVFFEDFHPNSAALFGMTIAFLLTGAPLRNESNGPFCIQAPEILLPLNSKSLCSFVRTSSLRKLSLILLSSFEDIVCSIV